MKKIKILFVYSDLMFGGIQRVLQLLSEELSKRKKYEIYLALFSNIQNVPFHGEIIDINAPSSKNYFLLFFNIIKRIIKLNKIVKEKEINVIISSDLVANFIALTSKKVYNFDVPLIVIHHNNFGKAVKSLGISGFIAKRYNIKFQDAANKIMCVSKGIENELAENGFDKNKLTTIYNLVSVDKINLMSKQKINSDHEFIFDKKFKIIISVGRLVEQKNFQLLIEAYMAVNNNIKCRLVIVGEGPERGNLEKLITDNDQQENIYLIGWHENPFSYLKRSDLFVLSSNWEGFGNVIIEAMACAIPVISTDCPFGPNEIIENNINGVLVTANDKLELSKAMFKVLSSKSHAEKLAFKGKQRSLDFSSNKIAAQYEKLINEVL